MMNVGLLASTAIAPLEGECEPEAVKIEDREIFIHNIHSDSVIRPGNYTQFKRTL